MKIKFIRFNDKAEIPVRKHYNDTGADIFMLEPDVLMPNETKVIPLGFGIDVPNGYTARIQVRSSMAKQGLFIQQCAIDAGYKGEIHMIVTNIGKDSIYWDKDDRLGYIEVYPCVYPELVEDLGEERGSGAFGSTGK